MRLLVVLASCVALCASSAIPSVPRDNSHYVEGISRYVWMGDDDGATHLVDLQEPINEEILKSRNGANNQYWLFTRSNPTTPQIIVNGNANSVRNSNYASNRPLNVVVHGWNGSGNSQLNTLITSALLAAGNVNVIVVDWRALSAANYVTAAAGAPDIGRAVGNFVVWLLNTAGGNWNNVHFIGFSLGGHAVGNAGRAAGGRPIRVTGLDPAGPGWYSNSNALKNNAGRYVEVIHTDIGVMGISSAIGHTDFYPNGGKKQPGCSGNQCSHSRAWELYASSVRTNHLVGRRCSDYNQATNTNNQCSGATLNMGNNISNKGGSGIYGLRTGSSWPF